MTRDRPPLLTPKAYDQPSVFRVEGLLREARRQRSLPERPVPDVCLLDPDGDVVRHLRIRDEATRDDAWACYHSEMWLTSLGTRDIGIVPGAVGAPYAVLVAEELVASGCRLIVSVTSAGRIAPLASPPYFVVVERAWRDEGTSIHYQPLSEWAPVRPDVRARLEGAFDALEEPVFFGRSWTTDAPFRETAAAIDAAYEAGIHCVEMEAAALYAYAQSSAAAIVCVAHVTNTMAVSGDDFEKGPADGTHRILAVVQAIADAVTP